MGLLTSKIFIFNCLFGLLWLIVASLAIKPLIPKTEEHKQRDKKFAAFRRNDIKTLQNFWLFIWYIPFALTRMVVPYFSIACMCCVTYVCTFFKSEGRNFTGLSFKIIRGFQIVSGWLVVFMGGFFGIKEEYVDYDYSKYLGPDWKHDKKKQPTAIICNH